MGVVEAYFEALARRDADAMAALWAPDGQEHIAGQLDAIGPHGVREYFTELFAAFPDFDLTVRSTVADGDRTAVHWTAVGTMAGPLWGLSPTGARVSFEGIDVLQVRDGRIARNDAVVDGMSAARAIGLLPPAGSGAEQRLFSAFNAKTRVARRAAARGARVLVGTARSLPALAEARVELDALVRSRSDEGESYRPGDLEPPPRLHVATAGRLGGTYVLAGGAPRHYQATAVPDEKNDSYGAGDSFAAGLTYALAEGLPVDEAIALAARTGAAALARRGAHGA
jgi:steroid delta-isomerase-like uncharacterized protein